MLMTMSTSAAPAATAAPASSSLMGVRLLPCGKAITAQTLTSEPSRRLFAIGTAYGLTQAVATSYWSANSQPDAIILSLMVGWSREWSIILASVFRLGLFSI